MNATNAVVENRMEQIQKAEPVQQLVVTGQYLYDQFITAGEEQRTRMAIIRDLVTKADALQIKGACDTMVDIAKAKDIANGVDEKTKGPKRNTAMYTRTAFQQIWGALHNAPDQMTAMGYNDGTGFNEARAMAKTALKQAGKLWTGQPMPTQAQREQKAALKATKAETTAFLEATKDTPRALNESFESWQARIAAVAVKQVAKAREDAMLEKAEKEIARLSKAYDRDTLALIVIGLQDVLKQSTAGQSEISEAEANALLAAAADGDVSVEEAEHVE